MLISHKYKFIFIKTKKTAGTSIELELSQIMGVNDVVTKIAPIEQGHIARNYILNGVKMYNHMPALEVKKIIGSDMFNSYFKFCVEREPVDKCLSHFSMLQNSPYHNKKNETLDWKTYVKEKKFPLDYKKYTDIRGRLAVDKIIKYEELKNDLFDIMNKLGVPFQSLKAFAKSGYRDKKFTVNNVTNEDKKIIYDVFKPSEAYTGYSLNT